MAKEAEQQQEKKTDKQRLKKYWPVIFTVIVALGLMMPLSNLIFKPVRPELPRGRMVDEHFARAAPVLRDKCLDCHSAHTDKPWYFAMPGAKQMISKDVADGVEAIDITGALFDADGEFSQRQLAKIESVTYVGDMPPSRYVMMHWDTSLSKADKKAVRDWVRSVRADRFASPDVAPQFAGEVIQPLPLTVELDEAKVELGDRLFHDKRLSADDTLACSGCHGLDKGGTDQEQFSTGVDEQVGAINAPTVYNSSYNVLQFWDGRAADLTDQADGPVNNPIEMASDWEQAVGKIKNDAYYKTAFAELYADGMNEKNIRDAIATFEKSLITPNSRFDKYLMGDEEAISESELAGYHEFIETGCTSCHFGVAVGGTHFEKMGKHNDYFADRGDMTDADKGRFAATEDEKDMHSFKVPLLRNIEVTHPYLHDGTAETLAGAIDIMSRYQLKEPLTAKQIRNIEKFLLTLTGQYKGKPLAE